MSLQLNKSSMFIFSKTVNYYGGHLGGLWHSEVEIMQIIYLEQKSVSMSLFLITFFFRIINILFIPNGL